MRSYALAIAFSVLLAALYAFQNPGDVTVRFLLWTRDVPQGVWEAAVFAGGCVLMWVVSLSAFLELRTSYRSRFKEQDLKIKKLEEERLSILRAISGGDQPIPPAGEKTPSTPPAPEKEHYPLKKQDGGPSVK